MRIIFDIYNKFKSVILYLFFGGCTTLINIVVYFISYNLLNISNVISTVIAWVFAVNFAFLTNKWFVFENKNISKSALLYEFVSFIICRLLTGLLDVGIMYVAVDCYRLNGLVFKILSNILVIILNFIASKLYIFKKK